MKTRNIVWLEGFYGRLCDGDWEHSFGCKISTLDNPGWQFQFDLMNSIFEEIEFTKIQIDRNANDWLVCCVEEKQFKGAGGPKNLDEIIGIFRSWVETHSIAQDPIRK